MSRCCGAVWWNMTSVTSGDGRTEFEMLLAPLPGRIPLFDWFRWFRGVTTG